MKPQNPLTVNTGTTTEHLFPSTCFYWTLNTLRVMSYLKSCPNNHSNRFLHFHSLHFLMITKHKLTQPQQGRGDVSQPAARCGAPGLGLRPAHPGAVEPGVNVVPAQRLGLGHQLLVGGRAVKHFGREHRRAAQHVHAPAAAGRHRAAPRTFLPPPAAALQAATSPPGRPAPSASACGLQELGQLAEMIPHN